LNGFYAKEKMRKVIESNFNVVIKHAPALKEYMWEAFTTSRCGIFALYSEKSFKSARTCKDNWILFAETNDIKKYEYVNKK